MSATSKVAVVVGVGPGLGQALAVRFARGGFRVALVARRDESVRTTQALSLIHIFRAAHRPPRFLAPACSLMTCASRLYAGPGAST